MNDDTKPFLSLIAWVKSFIVKQLCLLFLNLNDYRNYAVRHYRFSSGSFKAHLKVSRCHGFITQPVSEVHV